MANFRKLLNITNILYVLVFVLSILVFKNVISNKDNFYEVCPCPPEGLVQFTTDECTGDKLPPSKGECGSVIKVKNVKARCTGEGVAFPCKNVN